MENRFSLRMQRYGGTVLHYARVLGLWAISPVWKPKPKQPPKRAVPEEFDSPKYVPGRDARRIRGRRTGMGLKKWIGIGALTVGAARMLPGFYHMATGPEAVYGRVTAREEADSEREFSGNKHIVTLRAEGLAETVFGGVKINTFGIPEAGAGLREGCAYRFNLKGARFHPWSVSHSRDAVSVRLIECEKKKDQEAERKEEAKPAPSASAAPAASSAAPVTSAAPKPKG